MSNDLLIENLLNDWVKKRRTAHETEAMLANAGDTNPAETIALHSAAVLAIKRLNVLQQVQDVHNNYVHSLIKKAPVRFIRPALAKWALRIAASVLLFFGFRFAFEYANTNSKQLYTEIFEPYNINTDRSADNVPQTSIELVTLFKKQNYPAVIQAYKSLEKSGNREKFLTAYAQHQTGGYQEAVNLYFEILNNNLHNDLKLYNDEAEFYAALSYLKMKKPELARKLFRKIYETSQHTFHERVTKRTMRRLRWLD
jgi:tetratricopeptide (TPR) repeat protein